MADHIFLSDNFIWYIGKFKDTRDRDDDILHGLTCVELPNEDILGKLKDSDSILLPLPEENYYKMWREEIPGTSQVLEGGPIPYSQLSYRGKYAILPCDVDQSIWIASKNNGGWKSRTFYLKEVLSGELESSSNLSYAFDIIRIDPYMDSVAISRKLRILKMLLE